MTKSDSTNDLFIVNPSRCHTGSRCSLCSTSEFQKITNTDTKYTKYNYKYKIHKIQIQNTDTNTQHINTNTQRTIHQDVTLRAGALLYLKSVSIPNTDTKYTKYKYKYKYKIHKSTNIKILQILYK